MAFRLFVGVVRIAAEFPMEFPPGYPTEFPMEFPTGDGVLFTGRNGDGGFLIIGFGGSYLGIVWRCGGAGLLPMRACCSRQKGICLSAEDLLKLRAQYSHFT